MNQDSNKNTNQNTDPSVINQPLPQDPSSGGQVVGQISPETNTTPNVENFQSTPPIQIDNHEVPTSGGKKRILKIFGIFIFVILVLTVVAYVVYRFFIQDKYASPKDSQVTSSAEEMLKQTSLETTNLEEWSTYLNTVYGYTIDYPATWTTSVIADGESSEATINSNAFDIYDPESTYTYPVGVATLQTLDQEPFYDDSWEASEETINSVLMKKYVSVINDSMTSMTYLLDLGGEDYLEMVFRYEEGDGNKEIFDKMINSFTMLSSATPTGTTTAIDDENAYEGDFGDY